MHLCQPDRADHTAPRIKRFRAFKPHTFGQSLLRWPGLRAAVIERRYEPLRPLCARGRLSGDRRDTIIDLLCSSVTFSFQNSTKSFVRERSLEHCKGSRLARGSFAQGGPACTSFHQPLLLCNCTSQRETEDTNKIAAHGGAEHDECSTWILTALFHFSK